MQNGSQPHPPRSIEKSVPEVAPIQDFMDFLYYRSTRKCEKGFVKLFSWTVFFFLACYACACETNDLENSSNPFSYPRTPSPPGKRKRKKEIIKGTLLWKKNLPSRRRGAQNKRWRKKYYPALTVALQKRAKYLNRKSKFPCIPTGYPSNTIW